MYPNKSLPVYKYPLNPSQQLTNLPNSSSINYHTLPQSFNNGKSKPSFLTTNTNPHNSRHTQKPHEIPFKSNPSFTPFKPHQQQQQLAFGNTEPKANIPLKSSTISLAEFASDIEKEITNKVLKKLKLNQNNPNNILMVTMCKFVDDIMDNINDNMLNLRHEFKEQQQQQQQQLQQNINNKFASLTNILYTQFNNIQIKLKQSAQKQSNISTSLMNKKITIEQQILPIKQIENKIKTMTNKCLNNMQHQQKIYESSLEKMNKKLDEQTNKLIYNNNLGINKLLKQTKIIKNNFKNNKQFVSHQINNINDVKNMPNVKINDQNTLFNTLTDKQKTNDNLQNFTSNNINMAEFMNQAVNTLKTANTAIATIVNDNNINYVT